MYKFIIVKHFKKQLKPYAKKFQGLLLDVKKELIRFDEQHSVSLGNNIFKLRLSITKLKKGKNKSFRLIIYVIKKYKLLSPIAIYQKNKQDNIKLGKILHHLNAVKEEIKKYW